jgi:hypothetical protein
MTETSSITVTLTVTPTFTVTGTPTITPTLSYRQPGSGESYVFPQPADTVLNVVYTLSDAADVNLNIYNAAGRPVAELPFNVQPAGTNKAVVDLGRFSPGIYYYIIKTSVSGRTYDFNVNKFMVVK